MQHSRILAGLLLTIGLSFATPAHAQIFPAGEGAQEGTRLHFDVTFDDGYKVGERFDPAEGVNQIQAKAGGGAPIRKLTDIRNKLGNNEGNWTAEVAKGEPFDSAYLKFTVPAEEKFAGRFEMFHVPGDQKRNEGVWFVEFDYARLTEGRGGNELWRIEVKNRWGEIITAPAQWYSAFLGDWQNAQSNRDLTVGKVYRIRCEIDFAANTYRLMVDGEVTETGEASKASEFGGVSFVFMSKTADHQRVFGIDNLRVGRMAAATQAAVYPADAFVEHVGICGHLSYLDTPYADVKGIVIPRMQELGIRYFRTGYPLRLTQGTQDRVASGLEAMGAEGIRFLMLCGDEPIERYTEVLAPLRKYIIALEGPNETDLPQFNFNYQGEKFPYATRQYMRDLHRIMKGDERFADLPIVQTSMGWGKHAPQMGQLGKFADAANMHAYTAGHHVHGEALDDWHIPWARLITPEESKPMWITETGKSANSADELIQAKYYGRKLGEHFRRGMVKTFLYELIDVTSEGTHHGAFGLLRRDNTPRPAFHMVKNLLGLLEDPGEAFEPQPLKLDFEGATQSLRHVLLQKRDGRYYLLLWQEVQSWDGKAKQPLDVPEVALGVQAEVPLRDVKVYRPLESDAPVATQELWDESSRVSVPDHVIVMSFESER